MPLHATALQFVRGSETKCILVVDLDREHHKQVIRNLKGFMFQSWLCTGHELIEDFTANRFVGPFDMVAMSERKATS